MNDVKTDDKNLNALLTRGHLINFDPPDTEVIRQISTFAEDKEVVNFIKRYAPFSKSLNLRLYKRAVELKNSGIEWEGTILNELKIDNRLYVIEQLLKNHRSDEKRIEKWREIINESRTSYYKFKKKYLLKNPEKSVN